MNDNNQTFWYCSLCGFNIEEDESKKCRCGICKYPLPTVSWLFEGENGFFWCFTCNEKPEKIIFDQATDEDWQREQQKLNS